MKPGGLIIVVILAILGAFSIALGFRERDEVAIGAGLLCAVLAAMIAGAS